MTASTAQTKPELLSDYKLESHARLSDQKDFALPLVSVITPFYNDHKYLPDTIACFQDQTYPKLEMILIDDCSEVPPDDLIPKNPIHPIHLLRTLNHSGPAHARNLGISRASGEWVAFLDGDDLWTKDKIAHQIQLILKDPTLDWIYSDAQYIQDERVFPKWHSKFIGFTDGMPKGTGVNESHLRGLNYVTMSCSIMKRSAVLSIGGFREDLEISEDWDFYVRMAERFKVAAVNKPLSYYRLKSNGHHSKHLDKYVSVNASILLGLYLRQSLLPDRMRDYCLALARIYERVGIQYLNNMNFKNARRALFHPNTLPLRLNVRLLSLRVLSFLPPLFYKLAVWIYSHF